MALTFSLVIWFILLLATVASLIITFKFPNTKIGKWLVKEIK